MKKALLLGLAVAIVIVLIFFESKPVEDDVAQPPSPSDMRNGLVPDNSQQVIVVASDLSTDNRAQVSAFEVEDGRWTKVGGTYSARIAQNGFGDGTSDRFKVTPIGAFPLVTSLGAGENPGTKIPYRQVETTDCWITKNSDPFFPRWVSKDNCDIGLSLYSDPPGPYELAMVTPQLIPLDEATLEPLMIRRYDYSAGQAPLPTDGMVAMRREDLLSLVRWLDPSRAPVLVLGTRDWLLGNEPSVQWVDLAVGASGPAVTSVQQALNAKGFPTTVDGQYGTQTQSQVAAFQAFAGLDSTGVVDADTAEMLGLYSG